MPSKKEPVKKKSADSSEKGTNTVMVGVLAAVLIAFPVGYVVGAQTESDDTGDSEVSMDEDSLAHSDDMKDTSHSHSETYEVGDAALIPSVELMVMKDEKSGWNIMMQLENFTLTPENVSGEHVDNEGHAHLWVDGEKITRLYSANYHLGELSEGEHEIAVTLNTNEHADYTVDGEAIMDSVMVTDMHHSDDSSDHGH